MSCNRGEISIRFARAGAELGLQTVAVYSKEDEHSLHRYKADQAFLIGKDKVYIIIIRKQHTPLSKQHLTKLWEPKMHPWFNHPALQLYTPSSLDPSPTLSPLVARGRVPGLPGHHSRGARGRLRRDSPGLRPAQRK